MQTHSQSENHTARGVAVLRLLGGTLGWVATLALARFGPGLFWDEQQTGLTWAVLALNVLAGAAWIISFALYVQALDELERKIQLDALTVTLGVGFVLVMAYAAAATALAIPTVTIATFTVFLAAVYVIALIAGKIRYR